MKIKVSLTVFLVSAELQVDECEEEEDEEFTSAFIYIDQPQPLANHSPPPAADGHCPEQDGTGLAGSVCLSRHTGPADGC